MNILIDAYNIVRPHGTGVATYRRNLASAAAGLRHGVGLLFGTKAAHACQPLLLNEITLAEGDEAITARGRPQRKARLILIVARAVVHFSDRHAAPFSVHGPKWWLRKPACQS